MNICRLLSVHDGCASCKCTCCIWLKGGMHKEYNVRKGKNVRDISGRLCPYSVVRMRSAGDSRRYVVPTRRKFCSVMVERNFLRGGMKFTPWWNDLASAAFPFGHRGSICKRQWWQMEQSLVCFSMNIGECFSRNC